MLKDCNFCGHIVRNKLMCILAHPDDEPLSVGGTLAKYASEGMEIFLITTTILAADPTHNINRRTNANGQK